MLRLGSFHITDASEERLTHYGLNPLLENPIDQIVYAPQANSHYVIDAMRFFSKGTMPNEVRLRAVHDAWQEYIRHKVAAELTPLIDSVVEQSRRLNTDFAYLQQVVTNSEFSDETKILLYSAYLEEKTLFDLANLELVFYASILLDPDDSHRYLYMRSNIDAYEFYSNEALYPLDLDGSLRHVTLKRILDLTNTPFDPAVLQLNLSAKWPLWNSDVASYFEIYSGASRLFYEDAYMSAHLSASLRPVEPGIAEDPVTLGLPHNIKTDETESLMNEGLKKGIRKPRYWSVDPTKYDETWLSFLVITKRNTFSIRNFFINFKVYAIFFYYKNYNFTYSVLARFLIFFTSTVFLIF
jgi:hypothetical protein